MNKKNVCRALLGFAVAPAAASLVYGLVSWGSDFAPYILLLTLAVAYALTLVLMVPIFAALRKLGRYSPSSAIIAPAGVLGVLNLVYSVVSYRGHVVLETSAGLLVEAGELTAAGWLNLALDSVALAALGALAGGIFFLLYGRGHGPQANKGIEPTG